MTPCLAARRILVIQFRQIGDVLLSTPLLRALRQHYPQSYLAFCAEPSPARVLKHNPFLDEVLVYPRPATWQQAYRFMRRLRAYRFDLVLDLMGNPRSALLALSSGARQRIGFAGLPRALCYTVRVDRQRAVQEYTVYKRLRLLAPLGITATDLSLCLPFTAQDAEAVKGFLDGQGITPDDLLICLDPTSRVPTRQWPGEQVSRLADLLSERLGARVLLLWGPGEQDYVATLAARARSRPLLIPPWDLSTLAALLARADLFVGCNSAPLHIAVSQGTPTLAIHGATRPGNWSPPAPQHRAIAAGLPCQPCGKVYCGAPLHVACLRTLSAEQVFAAVQACAPWVPKLRRVAEPG
ncbi:MAG: heptosyltransferase [Candidatus Tectimicrobiota bacterium]|nr:MAG: heptosyltransferase [Candidatus Tectomicrobia bacterium]